jgi:hypothetical protein
VLLATSTHVSNGCAELLQAEAAVAMQRHVGAVALGQAGSLQQQQQCSNDCLCQEGNDNDYATEAPTGDSWGSSIRLA